MNRLAIILPIPVFLTIAQIGFAELLPQVPDSIQEPVRSELNTTRSKLDSDIDDLNTKSEALKAECAGALEHTAKGDDCLSKNRDLLRIQKTLLTKAKAFRSALAKAEAKTKAKAITVVDLAKDPELAKESQLRLDQINARLGRIQKAIDILGDSNPEWTKEMNNLREEQEEANGELMWNGIDLMTFGLAENYKYASEEKLKKAREVFQGQEFSELMRQKASLEKMRTAFGDTKAFDKWIGDLNKVEEASNKAETAETVARFRDFALDGAELYRDGKKEGMDRDAMGKLYHASTIIGEVAIPLVKGFEAEIAVPAQALFKLTEAGLRVKLMCEEEQQFNALSSQAVDRNHKKLELMKKKEELQNQAKELEMVIQRSKGMQ